MKSFLGRMTVKRWVTLAVVVALLTGAGFLTARALDDRTEAQRWLAGQVGVRGLADSGRWSIDEVDVRDADAARGIEAAIQDPDSPVDDGVVAQWRSGDTVLGAILWAGAELDDDLWRTLESAPGGVASFHLGATEAALVVDDLDAIADLPAGHVDTSVTVKGVGKYTAGEGELASSLEALRRMRAAGFDGSMADEGTSMLMLPDDEVIDAALAAGDLEGWTISEDLIGDGHSVDTGPWAPRDEQQIRRWQDHGALRVTADQFAVFSDDCEALHAFTHDHPSFLRCGAAGAYGTGAVGERLALVREVLLPEIGFLRYGDDGIYVSFSDPAAAPAVAEAVRELGWAGELAIEVRNGNDFRATFTSTADGSARSVSGDAELVDAWDATGGSDA